MTEVYNHGGPMTAYLKDSGLQTSPSDPLNDDISEHSRTRESEGARRPLVRRETSHRPLLTADQVSSRRSRFQALFSTALSPKLSPRDSAKFIDRFRYVICTSQLLAESIVPSDLNRRTSDITTIRFPDGSQGEWDGRKAAKHWMGSGGCVLLVSLIITWALRTPDRNLPSKARASAALVLSLVTALFMYAQARKAYSRHLHHQAATFIQSMVLHCQNFDSTTCRIINLIQEVELVSRGYRLGAVLPPIARIESNSRQRRCMRLRTAVVSALNLVYTAIGRASAELEQTASIRDYNKLSDVYNIIINDDDDLSILCDENDSIAYLKALFHSMHARRRKLLCCLLAIQADGRPGNARTWRMVAGQLSKLSQLVANLAAQLQDTLSDDSHVLEPNQIAPTHHVERPLEPDERQRKQTRGINNLSQTLRRTQAKMYILREESAKVMQHSGLARDGREELLAHYDSLGSDLNALLADWKEGRDVLLPPNPSSNIREQLELPGNDSSVEATSRNTVPDGSEDETLVIRPDSLGFWGPRMSIYNAPNLDGTGFTPLVDVLREEVFEGDTTVSEPKKPSLSRAERIAVMRQEREVKQARSEERRLQQQARQSLQGELKDVLGLRGRRSIGLRLGINNGRTTTVKPNETPGPSTQVRPLETGDRKISTSSQQSLNTMNSGLGSSVASHYDY